MEPLVSVIVPVFRVEKYLEECVQSLLRQTLKAVEIILVDDGSDDRCPELCDRFAAENDNILVFHQSNRGQPAARNVGIAAANGKYIAFCDSDDSMKPQMLEYMFKKAVEADADVVMAGYETFPNGRIWLPGIKKQKALSPHEFMNSCDTMHSGNELCFPWRFMIRAELLHSKKILFNESLRFGEDVPFSLESIMESTRIIVLQEALYNYRIDNPGSIMRTKYKPDLELVNTALYNKKLELTHRYGLEQNEAWMHDLAFYYITGFAGMLFRNAMHGPEQEQKAAVKRILRMPLLQENYRRFIRSKRDLIRCGRKNAIFWIACMLKWDSFVYRYVCKNYK